MQNTKAVMVVYEDTLDDSADADLPVTATRVKHLYKFVEDGGAATDYSNEDNLYKQCVEQSGVNYGSTLIWIIKFKRYSKEKNVI